MKNAINDHKGAKEYIINNQLKYTFERSLSLLEGDLTKKYRMTLEGVSKAGRNISKEYLADFWVNAVENNERRFLMYTIIQFSPTGNANYIAEQLARSLGNQTKVLPLEHTDASKLEKGNHLVVVYAIHAFNAPRTVKRFIKNLPIDLYKQVSLIGVGCNTSWANDSASKDVRKILNNKSYKIIVDKVIAMPLTFIMSFPNEVINAQLTKALLDIEQFSKDIEASNISHKGIAFKSNIVTFIGRAEPFASRFFGLELHAKKGCTQCGLCVRECPKKNIKMITEGKIHFGFKCIMCMRCIYKCPVQVITPRISKFIPISKGYSISNYLKDK